MGITTLTIIIFAIIASQASEIFSNHWLTQWTNDQQVTNSAHTCSGNETFTAAQDVDQRQYRVGVFAAAGFSQGTFSSQKMHRIIYSDICKCKSKDTLKSQMKHQCTFT